MTTPQIIRERLAKFKADGAAFDAKMLSDRREHLIRLEESKVEHWTKMEAVYRANEMGFPQRLQFSAIRDCKVRRKSAESEIVRLREMKDLSWEKLKY